MYASEMQICCYSSVKYFVGIKFHLYHVCTHLGHKEVCILTDSEVHRI
jgi:hypothetical protein